MADHLWFVPAAGAGRIERPYISAIREYELSPEINVQWQYSVYPTEQDPVPSEGCLRVGTNTLFSQATGPVPAVVPATLDLCYASWIWHSCTDGDDITVSGQLEVGTVFSRHLAGYRGPGILVDLPSTRVWNSVEAWVKMRVSSISTISGVYFVINDPNANTVGLNAPPVDWLTAFPVIIVANQWTVLKAHHSGLWVPPTWSLDNLRATLTVLGTTTPLNVGAITVDVEWFAFRLSDDVLP